MRGLPLIWMNWPMKLALMSVRDVVRSKFFIRRITRFRICLLRSWVRMPSRAIPMLAKISVGLSEKLWKTGVKGGLVTCGNWLEIGEVFLGF